MKAGEVDRSVGPWEYKPEFHKNDYRDDAMERVIPIGPRAQAILAPFLDRRSDPTAHVFDPRDSIVEAKAKRRASRAIPVKSYYDRRAYIQAIYRGCDRAFPHPVISKIKRSRTSKLTASQVAEMKEWRKMNRWCPLQIRHATATLVRKQFGLETAQAVLGHAKMDTTQTYAERQAELARMVAMATG